MSFQLCITINTHFTLVAYETMIQVTIKNVNIWHQVVNIVNIYYKVLRTETQTQYYSITVEDVGIICSQFGRLNYRTT